MWKPSKRLVMWILVILLIWNLMSLVVAYEQTQRRYINGHIIDPYFIGNDGPYFWKPEVDKWIAMMNEIDNNPHIIEVGYFASMKLTSSDTVQFSGFNLKKIGDNIQILETGETLTEGSSTTIYRYDLLQYSRK